ncbi:MAG: hypothetical protein HQL69_03850 [Magnetococcales bacterium]|nr:hypothetical protein [Magnetococcales bacterium]
MAAGTDTVDGGASIDISTKSSLKISLNQATGAWTAAAPVQGGIQNLADDTSPELSGTLVGNDNTISSVNLKGYGEITNALGDLGGGSADIDLTLGNVVSATVSTATQTFTFSNPTAADEGCGFVLVLINGGSQTVNWPASCDFAGGTAPTLTTAGVDILTFFTIDGGTTWHGNLAIADSK